MPQETETVTGNPEAPQENTETPKENEEQLVEVSSENDSQPSVQEDACVLKEAVPEACSLPKSPVAEATEEFLQNEKNAYAAEAAAPQPVTPANSESSDGGTLAASEEQPPSTVPQVVEVSVYSETVIVDEAPIEEPVIVLSNGNSVEETLEVQPEPEIPVQLTNGQSNGECKFESRKNVEPEPEPEEVVNDDNSKPQVLNGTIASELVAEDYRLPDVVEVKKNFEFIEPTGQNIAHAPPKKGALSTRLDSQNVKKAYQDVRQDATDTQWAVFKFEGPTIVTSATGSDFGQFKKQFGDDERAFGYIRVQTGDEMSRRAKFMFLTWVGPSVSVLKRAKMSTDKSLIKDVVSNFAVELQTENISDIDLQNFEAELDKAAGAHYGTGVRS